MKTKLASLLVVILLTTTQCVAQRTIRVEAQNDDISNNLDLQAVASLFGESKDLQEFEMKLNDYDSQISNLDLNNDGEVDYLRVIESSEDNVHIVVIQAVLDRDVFQDVATIVVERNRNRRTYVQVIGDPYLYGDNYIVEPVYIYTPYIYSYFWGNRYQRWNSPYYWGYYPRYYHVRHPFAVNVYMSHIDRHINHDHRYYYSDRRRYNDYERLHNTVSRNDFGRRYPDRTFINRNENVRNKQEYEIKRNTGIPRLQTRPSNQVNESRNRNTNSTINTRPNTESRNSNINERNVNERPNVPRNSEMNQTRPGTNDNRPTRQIEPANNTRTVAPVQSQPNRENTQTRPINNNDNRSTRQVVPENSPRQVAPVVSQPTREVNQPRPANNNNQPARQVAPENNTRQAAPVVSQPSRTETKPAERKPAESNRSNQSNSERGNGSSNRR